MFTILWSDVDKKYWILLTGDFESNGTYNKKRTMINFDGNYLLILTDNAESIQKYQRKIHAEQF